MNNLNVLSIDIFDFYFKKIALLLLSLLTMYLIFLGFKNPPSSGTDTGVFSIFLLAGCLFSVGPSIVAFLSVGINEKKMLRWFYVSMALFMGFLYLGLYKYLTF